VLVHSGVLQTSRPGFDSLTVHVRPCPGSSNGRGAALRPRKLGVRIPRRVRTEGWLSGPRRRPAKANRSQRRRGFESLSFRLHPCGSMEEQRSTKPLDAGSSPVRGTRHHKGRVAPGGGQPVLKTGSGSLLRVRLLHLPRLATVGTMRYQTHALLAEWLSTGLLIRGGRFDPFAAHASRSGVGESGRPPRPHEPRPPWVQGEPRSRERKGAIAHRPLHNSTTTPA
jgi:hypothetical protein